MRWALVVVSLLACVVAGGAAVVSADDHPTRTELAASRTTTTSVAIVIAADSATTSPSTATTTAPTTTTALAAPREVSETHWSLFAVAGRIGLAHPAARVERVAFHQSNHEGARHLDPQPTTVAATLLEARERLTDGQTAADIVVPPDAEIRAPVTGTVKRAGTYTLYCKHRDDYVVIAPDAHPAWEVKLLHIDGVVVRSGQRVVSGQTVLAPRATALPFESQVDELRTADPAWPHVHLEVVDPAIRNIPSPGGGC